MPSGNVILQSHHIIENSTFLRNRLLNKLVEHGLIDKDVSTNRLYLPVDGKLADEIETSPHRGRTRSSYTMGIAGYLDDLGKSPDGRAAMRNDAAALKRVAAQVHDLQDTLKVALINGDMFATTPDHLTKAETNAQSRRTLFEIDQYRAIHADQLKTLRSMSTVESEWAAITHSEQRIATVIEAARTTGKNLVAVPDERDAVIREIAGREEFRMAIAHAEEAWRVTLSESNAAMIRRVLDDTPLTIRAARSIAHLPGTSPHPYMLLSQRGFATAELLAGELSAGQVMRTAGPRATAADAVASGPAEEQRKPRMKTAGVAGRRSRAPGPALSGSVGVFLLR